MDTMPLDLAKRNLSKAISWSLGDLTKNIVWYHNIYKVRAAIIFHGAERCGLKAATGHCYHSTTCALRSHEK